jgi:hypothetical protein
VFTKALEARVDYFQAKCLRNILKVGAAFYSRVSNKDVLNRASQILYGEDGKVRPVSKVISDRAITLLGHLIRAENTDQMRKVAIDAEFKRVERYKRRVGRPRFYWLQNTMARAHKLWRKNVNLPKVRFDINNANLRKEIAEAANNREHPFNKKSKLKRRKLKKKRSQRSTRSEGGVKHNSSFTKKRTKRPRREHEPRKQCGSTQNNGPHEGSANNNDASSQSHQGNRQRTPPRGTNSHQGNSQTPNQGHFREAVNEAAARRLEILRRSLEPHFAFMGCKFTVDIASIKRAYRKKALVLHPDKGGDAEQFKKLGNSLDKVVTAIATYLQIFPQMACDNEG